MKSVPGVGQCRVTSIGTNPVILYLDFIHRQFKYSFAN